MRKTIVSLLTLVVLAIGIAACGTDPGNLDWTDQDYKFKDINSDISNLRQEITNINERIDSLVTGGGDNTVYYVIDEETKNTIDELVVIVENLQDQLDALEAQVDQNTQDISDLQDKCDEAFAAIAALEQRVSDLEDAIEALQGGEPPAQRGSALYSGSGPPGNIIGAIVGDFYIDLTPNQAGQNYFVYVLTADGWDLFGELSKATPKSIIPVQ